MADGRDVQVWDKHAQECREAKRLPFGEDAFQGDIGKWLRDTLLKYYEENSEVKALDLGCGPGYWKNLFKGFSYTGCDQSQEMLNLAKEHSPEIRWVKGNARTISDTFNPEEFDIVFTSSVLQHNRNYPDKREIVEEIYKILKPGGILLCTENTFPESNYAEEIEDLTRTDGYSFSPSGWKDFMMLYNFHVKEFNGRSEYLFQKV